MDYLLTLWHIGSVGKAEYILPALLLHWQIQGGGRGGIGGRCTPTSGGPVLKRRASCILLHSDILLCTPPPSVPPGNQIHTLVDPPSPPPFVVVPESAPILDKATVIDYY